MIEFRNIRVTREQETLLEIPHWLLGPDQHWALFSYHGLANACLRELLCRQLHPDQGQISGLPEKIASVSLEQQQRLVEQELARLQSDGDQLIDSRSVSQVLQEALPHAPVAPLLEMVDLSHLAERPFLQLSTGETRRLMLAMALGQSPELLVLDEPYAGLDACHQQQLKALLDRLSDHCQLVLLCSRLDDLPACINHVALLDAAGISLECSQEQWRAHPIHQKLAQDAQSQARAVANSLRPCLSDFEGPVFQIDNGQIRYHTGVIFKGLDWRVEPGEHWQVMGPNGCGKSSLLSLISGDHPQCYSNQIQVFGKPRGQGESIWEIKQQLGIVSSSLHLQYRVNCSALDVVLSGLFDSIGLYQKVSPAQQQLARRWLTLLQMEEYERKPMRSLSYGEQRLLLIARALIKGPLLLLLDEPCQGLDFISRQMVLRALGLIAEHKLTQLIYVTHHQDEALPGIDNQLVFTRDGILQQKVQTSDSASELATSDRLRPLRLA